MSKIEWTEKTWNPIRGCSRVSAGCTNCYAERQAIRFAGEGGSYEGLVQMGAKGPRWTGKVRFVADKLDEPLRWRKPHRVFVNSMSDLFHESLSNEQIAAIFGVMAGAPTHTFQVLTKRPQRMLDWFGWIAERARAGGGDHHDALFRQLTNLRRAGHAIREEERELRVIRKWPLPNVWIGVSVEDQKTADERIPLLLKAPAAIRWISYEPALGPLVLHEEWKLGCFDHCPIDSDPDPDVDCDGCAGWGIECGAVRGPKLDWVVIGGESGPGARFFEVEWAHDTIRDCQRHGVAVFMKQFGSMPQTRGGGDWLRLADRKGGDITEWPDWARVREWPET